MYPGDKTCILSTLEFICKLATKHKISTVLTFDQPLFWKASEIVNEVEDSSPLKEVLLLLGSFHMLMNLLGAIGTSMEGSGLKEILETIYGENAVVHMMKGKAVQRALRGHLLVDQCLTNQIVSQIIESEQEFEIHLLELEQLYSQTKDGIINVATLSRSDCMDTIACSVAAKKCELSESSKTSKLCLNYQQMLRIVRELIEADRTGSWEMHLHAISECLPIFAAAGHPNYLKSAYLYLQKMTVLEIEHPDVFQKFMQGYHVIRRSDKFWAGLGCDLVIEQTLMRSLKSTGGLTRGSGMTEHLMMSSPVSSAYNCAMQQFCEMRYTSSEQHKEETLAAGLKQNDCHVVQAEGDADVDIIRAVVDSSKQGTTTLIGEDTDLLILLLYHGDVDCKDVYFRSDKGKLTVYNIRVLKGLLGEQVCTDLLFVHAFTGCDTSSRIFGIGKKLVFQKVIKGDSVLRSCSNIFCATTLCTG